MTVKCEVKFNELTRLSTQNLKKYFWKPTFFYLFQFDYLIRCNSKPIFTIKQI